MACVYKTLLGNNVSDEIISNVVISVGNVCTPECMLCQRSLIEHGAINAYRAILTGNHIYPTINDNNAVRHAAANGHTEVVKLLLAWVGPKGERVDVTARDNYAIRRTAINGHTEIVKLLLAWVGPKGERVDVTTDNNSTIRHAAGNGHTDVVKLLEQWKPLQEKHPQGTTDSEKHDTKIKIFDKRDDYHVIESERLVILKVPSCKIAKITMEFSE